MNIGVLQNSQQSFSSLRIRVKDTGAPERKRQLDALRNELPFLKQMPEVEKYEISIVGKNDFDEQLPECICIKAKRPNLFKPKTAMIEYCGGSVESAIRKAVEYLHEKELRKENGINFRC